MDNTELKPKIDEQKEFKEYADLSVEFFTPAEKKQIFLSLLTFIDTANTLSEADTQVLFIDHLQMYAKELKIHTEHPPVTTWVRNSLLGPQKEWLITSRELIASLYNPSYEGEYYFTPSNPVNRQAIDLRVAYYLLTLEISDDSLKEAIHKRKIYLGMLGENPELNPLNLNTYQWFALCQKIRNSVYSESLKMALILDLYYKTYLCIKNTILVPEHIESALITFEMELNALDYTHNSSSRYYETLNLLLAAVYYHSTYVFKDDFRATSFQEKAIFYFEKAIQYLSSSIHLLHHTWIQNLKNIVFEYHFNHMPLQNDKPSPLNATFMAESDCIDTLRVAYQNISTQELNPKQKAKQLLILSETAQRAYSITDSLISFLLEIYYEVYVIFNNPQKVLSDYQEILFEFFVCLKKLLILEKVNSKFHEIINLLICTSFECGMPPPANLNYFSKFEHSDLYFKRAIQCHLKNKEPISHAWANPLRLAMLRSIPFGGKQNHSTLQGIVLSLISTANEKATTWLNPDFTKLLSLKERKNISLAINYYSMVVWLKNVNLYDDTILKCHATTLSKISTLTKHLERSLIEEGLIITEPIISYIKSGNPLFPGLDTLIKSTGFQQQTFMLALRDKPEQKLSLEQFRFLLEICNEKTLTYSSGVNEIIWLTLYHQIYRFVKSNKTILNKTELTVNLENNILLLQQKTDENSILIEAYFILLFQVRHLFNKTTRELSEVKEKTESYFVKAIQFPTTQFLKAPWLNTLRKKALLRYTKHFCTIPKVQPYTSLEKLFEYLKVISQTPPKNKNEKRYILEANHILSWARGVELLKEPMPEVLTEIIPENIQTVKLDLEPNLEKQRKAEARRIKAEDQKKELEAKEELERIKRAQEQKIKEEARKQLALEKAQEDARKQQEKEKYTQAKLAKRIAKQAEKERLNAEKIKNLEQEIAQKELKRKQEQEAIELKKRVAQQEQIALATKAYETQIQALKDQNFILKQERKAYILERPLRSLRNFSMDEFSRTELSPDNLQSLNSLVNAVANFGILEIYGSYVVFLASLRLGIPLEKIKTPGDIDIRIKLGNSALPDYTQFIQKLSYLGFECQEFDIKSSTEETLQHYIQMKKQKGGHLNLFKAPTPNTKESYEIELAILFPNYRPNTYPFPLLRHYISIQGNTASFNNANLKATKQLANSILKRNFDCNLHEVMTLGYNVFNFFPRAIKNLLAWGPFFNAMKKGNLSQILNNPKLIQDFFKIRFYARKHKDCYLEIAGLITQQYFLRHEANLILQGFLNAFFHTLNIESNDKIKQNLIDPKRIPSCAKKITKQLRLQFKENSILFGETKEKNETCQAFYRQLIYGLDRIFINADQTLKSFLENSRRIPTSILFDLFRAFQQPELFLEPEITECVSPSQTPLIAPYMPYGTMPYSPPCMQMPYPTFYPYDPYLLPPPLVYAFPHQMHPVAQLPPPPYAEPGYTHNDSGP